MIYHIVAAGAWSAANDPYIPAGYAVDGFVHCSEAGQVEEVANEIGSGAGELVVLEIDEGLVGSPVRREDSYSRGRDYPHVYGPIPRGAVLRVLPLLRGADGRLRLPLGAVAGAASAADLVLRRARAEDAPRIAQFRCAMFRDMHPEKDYSSTRAALESGNVDYHRRHASDPGFVTFVVEAANGPVGCASLIVEERPPHADRLRNITGYVLSVYVEPAFRGRGAARALMGRILEEAAARGVARLSLHASVYGKPLYLSLGFKPNPDYLELVL